jgi:hypothetical protein
MVGAVARGGQLPHCHVCLQTDLPLFSILSPSKVPANTMNTNVRELVIGTANDNSVVKKIKPDSITVKIPV